MIDPGFFFAAGDLIQFSIFFRESFEISILESKTDKVLSVGAFHLEPGFNSFLSHFLGHMS